MKIFKLVSFFILYLVFFESVIIVNAKISHHKVNIMNRGRYYRSGGKSNVKNFGMTRNIFTFKNKLHSKLKGHLKMKSFTSSKIKSNLSTEM